MGLACGEDTDGTAFSVSFLQSMAFSSGLSTRACEEQQSIPREAKLCRVVHGCRLHWVERGKDTDAEPTHTRSIDGMSGARKILTKSAN